MPAAADVFPLALQSCLGQELSDREIPLTTADQTAFLNEVLRRSSLDPGPEGALVGGHAIPKDQAGNRTQATGDSTLPTQMSNI